MLPSELLGRGFEKEVMAGAGQMAIMMDHDGHSYFYLLIGICNSIFGRLGNGTKAWNHSDRTIQGNPRSGTELLEREH